MHPIENSLTGQSPHCLQKSPKPPKPKEAAWKADVTLRNVEGDKKCIQYQGFLQTKAVETIPQNPTLTQPTLIAIPILQVATIGTYVQPGMVTTPTQPVATTSEQPQQVPHVCALYMSIGRQFQNNYLLPIHPEWSNPEEEKDHNKQQKEEEQ